MKRPSVKLGLLIAEKKLPGQRYNDEAPLAFGYFISFLARHMPGCEVVVKHTPEELVSEGVDIVGISSSTEYFEQAKSLARVVKAADHGIPVIVGGAHITFMPQNLSPEMDVAVMGEGEYTLLELLSAYVRDGKRFLPSALSSIRGIAHRPEGRLVVNESRPPIANLDELPIPDRKAIWIGGLSKRAYIFTSRGCPYHCVFCASTRFWPKLRQFSASYVADEIDHIANVLGIWEIHFFDDLFIVPKKRLDAIIERLTTKGLLGRIAFSGAVRANLVDDAMCESLKRLGVREVMFGAESFSEQSLGYLKCNTVTPAQNQKAIDVLCRHGIKANVAMIFGSPTDTEEELGKSFRALESNLSSGKLNKWSRGVLRPYPGTPIWDDAVSQGVASEGMNWDKDFTGNELYMGPIPKPRFYALWNAHERRCRLLKPSTSPLWTEWGLRLTERQLLHALFLEFATLSRPAPANIPDNCTDGIPPDLLGRIEDALASGDPALVRDVIATIEGMPGTIRQMPYFNRVLSLARVLVGDLAVAPNAVTAGITLDPENALLQRDQAIVRLLLGDRAGSLGALQSVLAAYPDDQKSNRLLATLLLKDRDFVGFVRVCERLLCLCPTDQVALLLLAEYYDAIEDPVAADYMRQRAAGVTQVIPGAGFYDDHWMARTGSMTIHNNKQAVVFRSRVVCADRGYYPSFPFSAVLSCNDEPVLSVLFDESYQAHEVELTIGAGCAVSVLKFSCDASFTPSRVIAGSGDTRDLSVQVHDSSVEEWTDRMTGSRCDAA